ncbi:uncharacterized protein LOC135486889 [Lineus longissimus]|uniref:uncharacterized protein LOC135486889 n=1 Tax=Lineus longissimus TaxID=88925 RepID=UPI002B4E2439
MAAPAANGYNILLVNPGPQNESPAKKRQEAFTRIVENTKPSIIFTQECNKPFVKNLSPEYLRVGNDDAGFIFNENEFLLTDLTHPGDTSFLRLIEELGRKEGISVDFQSRGYVVKLKSNGVPNLEVLAVSWHGNNTVKDEKRSSLLENLFLVVKEMRKLPNFKGHGGELLPVIVGGDFNLVLQKWPRDPELVYHTYKPSARRQGRVIDLFVSTKGFTLEDCKFVNMSFELDDTKPASEYLSHDPIQGVLAYSGIHDTGGSDDSDCRGDFGSSESGKTDHTNSSDHCGEICGSVCTGNAGKTVENEKPKTDKLNRRNDTKGKVSINEKLGKNSHGGRPRQENSEQAPTSRIKVKATTVAGIRQRTDMHPCSSIKPSSQQNLAASANGYNILLISTGSGIPVAKCKDAFRHVRQFVEEVKPSIIFTQQITGPFVKGLGHDYKELGTPKAGFIFNKAEFWHRDLMDDRDLSDLVKRLRDENDISRGFEFLERVHVVRFTSKSVHGLDVIALAWHGQYGKKGGGRLTDETMIRFLRDLFLVVEEMQKLQNFRGSDGRSLPVIIGGDFKLEVTKWPRDNTILDYHKYTPSVKRKQRLVDMFLTTKDLTVTDCKFLKANDGKTAMSDFLNNDLVQGVLAYSSPSWPH